MFLMKHDSFVMFVREGSISRCMDDCKIRGGLEKQDASERNICVRDDKSDPSQCILFSKYFLFIKPILLYIEKYYLII